MSVQDFQYLESLDSVRLTPITLADDAAKQRLLIFSEVLMTLALNRDVVVPQSYAFDSWGCAQVAAAVLRARDEVFDNWERSHERSARPFRVHLYAAGSFTEAVIDMLKRMDNAEKPFISSSFPTLNHTKEKAATRLAKGIKRSRSFTDLVDAIGAIDRDAAASFGTAWSEFLEPGAVRGGGVPKERNKKANEKEGNKRESSMSRAVRQLVEGDSELMRLLKATGFAENESVGRLRAALSTLHGAASRAGTDAFEGRSHVHSPGHWPGIDATARELVDGDMELVTEFIDSLYNSTVASSMGLRSVLFSTPVLPSQQIASSYGTVQDLALLFREGGGSAWPTQRPGNRTEFSVTVSARAHGRALETAPARLTKALRELEARQVEAFRVLLEARKNPAFTASANSLHHAVSAGDPDETARAIEKHISLVGRLYGALDWDIGPTGQVVMKIAGAIAEALTVWALGKSGDPNITEITANTAGRMSESGVNEAWRYLSGQNRSHHLAHALGRLVHVQPASLADGP